MPSTACWEFPCCKSTTGRHRWPGPDCPWNNCLRNSVKSCSSRCSIRRVRQKHPTVLPWFCQKRPWFSKAWPKSWAWTHCGRADKGNTRAAPSISFRSATYLCFFGIPSKLPLDTASIGHRKITACLASIQKRVYRQTKSFTSAFIQRIEIECAEKFFMKVRTKVPTLTWISESFFQEEQLS